MERVKLGKYTLIEELGKGGFGTVYKAVDLIGRTVAVKVLKPGWSDDPDTVGRFRQEAMAAGSLFHKNIATILEMDEADGRLFLVMRYVDGKSLDQTLKENGPLDWDEALEILKQIAEALDYAHQKGFVHRDVKPGNILISETDGAVLTDFGLVKAATVSGYSTSGVMLGTPNYIAPEVWNGKSAGIAADVYSLACVFYEMLMGKRLFEGDSAPAVMTKHMLHGPQFPEEWPEGVPQGFTQALRKALEKEPEDRWGDMIIFSDSLQTLDGNTVKPENEQKQNKPIEEEKIAEEEQLDQVIAESHDENNLVDQSVPIINQENNKRVIKTSNVWTMKERENRQISRIHIVITVLLIGISVVVANYDGYNLGGVRFMFSVPFQNVGGIWFGGWGVIASALFQIISNGITGNPLYLGIIYNPANVISSFLPAWGFRKFRADPGLKSRYDWAIFLGTITVSNLLGILWRSLFLPGFEILTTKSLILFIWRWFAGSEIASIVFGSILLKIFSKKIVNSKVFVKSWWS